MAPRMQLLGQILVLEFQNVPVRYCRGLVTLDLRDVGAGNLLGDPQTSGAYFDMILEQCRSSGSYFMYVT